MNSDIELASAEELEEFRVSVHGFLARHSDRKAIRALIATDHGFDEEVWLEAANQLGLQGLVIPDDYGGSGFTAVEQGVLLEELGRALYVGPYLSSSVFATNVVLHCDDDELKAELLPELAAGAVRVTVAIAERDWEQGLTRPTVTALAFGDEWHVTGEKHLVLDGATAHRIFLTAATPSGTSLFLVDTDAPGVQVEAVPVVDLTRKQSSVRFNGATARLVGEEGGAAAGLRRAVDLAVAALAAEQVGAAAEALQITIDYLKVREQFGRPLASFQALKHRAADMHVAVATARALAGAALLAGAREHWDDLGVLAGLAKVRAWEVLDDVSAQAVQLHGGVGFTWDFDPQLYFKRARGTQFLFGDVTSYRERAAISIGL